MAAIIIPGQSGTYRHLPGRVTGLLAESGLSMAPDLAGFAVEYTDPDGQTLPVLNRLGFTQAITSATTPEQRQFIPTSEAPLQKFHWVHFPPDVKPGTFTYKATAMLFQPGSETALSAGPSTEIGVVLMPRRPDLCSSALPAGTFLLRLTPSSSITNQSNRHRLPSTSIRVLIRRSIGGSGSTLVG